MTEIKTRKDYNSFTVKQLQDELEDRAFCRGNNIGSFNSKTRKDELIDLLMSDDIIEMASSDKSYTDSSQTLTEIPLSKIEICPLNPRPEMDYPDPDHQDNLRAANGVIGTITVTKATNIDPDADDDIYYVIAGNRTTYNLKVVVEKDKWADSLDDYMVGCQVRNYCGSLRENKAQALREIMLDHASSREFTIIDQLRLIETKLDLGLSNSQIAKEMDVSPSMVSKIKRLSYLGERIQAMVQAFYRQDLYKNKCVRELNDNGVKFQLTEDGVKIFGINQTTAFVMSDLFPRKPSVSGFFTDEEYQNALYSWVATRDNLREFLSTDKVVRRCQLP